MALDDYLQVDTSSGKRSNKSAVFKSNEELVKSYKFNKSLGDCCYSVANVSLIVASIIALTFTIQFLFDDPLYEYGEHLLTRRFYYQLIFIIIILPLGLLVPIFNALSGFLLTQRKRLETGACILTVKLIYQALIALLAFLGLIFIVPSIRTSSVRHQVDFELRRHMKRRYENNFSFEFLDRIQEKYQCCDEPWYRANYFDKIPLTCFQPDGYYSTVYERNCTDVLASIVSNRCSIIAASLLAILISLIILLVVDILELVSLSRERKYYVEEQESRRSTRTPLVSQSSSGSLKRTTTPASSGNQTPKQTDTMSTLTSNRTAPKESEGPYKQTNETAVSRPEGHNEMDDDDDDDAISSGGFRNSDSNSPAKALEVPLLGKRTNLARPAPLRASFDLDRELDAIIDEKFRVCDDDDLEHVQNRNKYDDNDDSSGDQAINLRRVEDIRRAPIGATGFSALPQQPRHLGGDLTKPPTPTSPLLTRASFVYARSQSPVLRKVTSQGTPSTSTSTLPARHKSPDRPVTPTKGVLKKTSSFQRVAESGESLDEQQQQQQQDGDPNMTDHYKQMHRDLQTRRSLLNVRFAD